MWGMLCMTVVVQCLQRVQHRITHERLKLKLPLVFNEEQQAG